MKPGWPFLVILMLLSWHASAQTPTEPAQKIGHANWQYIFNRMPEYKQIEVELRTFETQLQNQLHQKSEEFDKKYNAYQALPANTPEAIRRDKESELAYMKTNIQKFQQEASAAMEKKQGDLIAPVFEKVAKAIDLVATENGYTYIINPQMLSGGDVLLYTNEKYNISDLVLKKLGVSTAR
jgi:outer membrane protein